MADEQVKTQARETDAVADSNVVAVYQRLVELVTKAWSRCTIDALLLVATGLVLVFTPHATFIRPTRHAIWLMPLLRSWMKQSSSQRCKARPCPAPWSNHSSAQSACDWRTWKSPNLNLLKDEAIRVWIWRA